jgi:acetyl esterase/lipase
MTRASGRMVIVAGGFLALAGLSGARERPVPEGVRVERDVEYARVGDRVLTLDLYLPEEAEGPRPVVVWIHGGAWWAGSKDNAPAARLLATKGYAVVSVDYRLTGQATFPAQIADCKAAIRWVRAHAERYGLDPDHIGAWGSSAGGHLVALLGTAGDVAEWDGAAGGHGEVSSRVQAVCDFYGPADLAGMPDRQAAAPDSPVARLLGAPASERRAEARRASPVSYVSEDDPPFLIVHGEEDRTVPIAQSERLHEVLQRAGVETTLVRVAHGGHGFGPASDPSRAEIAGRVLCFFDQHLKAAPREEKAPR